VVRNNRSRRHKKKCTVSSEKEKKISTGNVRACDTDETGGYLEEKGVYDQSSSRCGTINQGMGWVRKDAVGVAKGRKSCSVQTRGKKSVSKKKNIKTRFSPIGSKKFWGPDEGK